MSVSEDQALIDRATRALAGPQHVWVLIVSNDSNFTCATYATEQAAREAWISALKTNYTVSGDYHDAIARATSSDWLEFPVHTFWSLRECEVQS